jgi:hypothetical protein
MGHDVHTEHSHVHGEHCGHTAVQHNDHLDYLHEGHLHAPHEGHYDEHVIPVSSQNPDSCAPTNCGCTHNDCGHETVPHGDHTDYLYEGQLHHPHGGHCDNHGTLAVATS